MSAQNTQSYRDLKWITSGFWGLGGEEEMESDYYWDRVSFRGDKNVPQLNSGDGCTSF